MENKTDFITQLSSGGLITNYNCTSRCRHCLYACSPKRGKAYINTETTQAVFRCIRNLGCSGVHIGGGEPFLNPDGLINVIRIAGEEGVQIDYVETNSSWYKDPVQAGKLLTSLVNAGCSTLLISISPYHNEFIPFKKVKGVLSACRKVGMNVFPWVQEFAPDIEQVSPEITHSLDEYEQLLGPGYIAGIPGHYWVSFRGRALHTYRPYMEKMSLEAVTASSRCRELFDTTHFHIDLHGNYIPGLCSGLSVSCKDLGRPLKDEKYPYLSRLIRLGIRGLYQYARETKGFTARDFYVSKCELCQEIRTFLVCIKGIESPDLMPIEFYKALMEDKEGL